MNYPTEIVKTYPTEQAALIAAVQADGPGYYALIVWPGEIVLAAVERREHYTVPTFEAATGYAYEFIAEDYEEANAYRRRTHSCYTLRYAS